MCSAVETLSRSDAVFVGRVVDVWPSRNKIASEAKDLSLAALRRSVLRRWRGVLSAEEERDIRANSDRSVIEFNYGLLQRVRFMVNEVLVGPEVREVYTDASSCGYHFEQARAYLVHANRKGTRYWTGACSRTNGAASEEAVDDLIALRASRSRRPLPPWIYGRVGPGELRTGIRVILTHDQEEQVIEVDAGGRFSFDGLEKKVYRLQVVDQRGTGERDIDLSRLRCFEAFPWFGSGWHIAGFPVVIDSRPVALPDPPSLLPTAPPR